jgi:1-acyl-sn-glycerol-3-phosphate acyltransferase
VWYLLLKTLGQVSFILFFKYRAYGTKNVPRNGALIIASNHQSYMDPVAVGIPLVRRFGSLARESLFRNPAFGWLLRALGSMPLDRGSADLGAMRAGLRLLKDGKLLLLFPEGTRTQDGSIGELQPGLAVLASRSGAVVVPAVIDGAYEAWPRKKLLPGLGRVRVAYGRPMKYEGHGSKEAEAFIKELHARMVELQTGLKDGSIQRGQLN